MAKGMVNLMMIQGPWIAYARVMPVFQIETGTILANAKTGPGLILRQARGLQGCKIQANPNSRFLNLRISERDGKK